jgi:hypothetical protein
VTTSRTYDNGPAIATPVLFSTRTRCVNRPVAARTCGPQTHCRLR